MLLAKMRKNDIITHSWRCFCISHPSLPPHFFTSLSPLLSTNGSDSSQSSLRRDGTLTTANASGGEPGSGGPARMRRICRAPGASSRRGREGGRRAGAEIRAPGEGRRERERAALAVPQRRPGGADRARAAPADRRGATPRAEGGKGGTAPGRRRGGAGGIRPSPVGVAACRRPAQPGRPASGPGGRGPTPRPRGDGIPVAGTRARLAGRRGPRWGRRTTPGFSMNQIRRDWELNVLPVAEAGRTT